jgi:hypothetical protein
LLPLLQDGMILSLFIWQQRNGIFVSGEMNDGEVKRIKNDEKNYLKTM